MDISTPRFARGWEISYVHQGLFVRAAAEEHRGGRGRERPKMAAPCGVQLLC